MEWQKILHVLLGRGENDPGGIGAIFFYKLTCTVCSHVCVHVCFRILIYLVFVFYFKSMYSFLAQPNAIAHLDLSNTECSLDMVTYVFLYIVMSGGLCLRTAT